MENAVLTSKVDEVLNFVEQAYSPQFYEVVKLAIDILDALSYPDYVERLSDELYAIENEDPAILDVKFREAVTEMLTDALKQQGIALQDVEELGVITEIAAAVYRVQSTPTPDVYLTAISSDVSNEEKMASVLEDFCLLDETTILTHLESVDDGTMMQLERVLNQRAEQIRTEEEIQAYPDYSEQLAAFIHYTSEKGQTLASQMLDAGFSLGRVAEDHYPFVKESLQAILDSRDVPVIAINLLGYLYLHVDTYRNPVEIYGKVWEKLGVEPGLHGSIQDEMIRVVNELTQFRKVSDDTSRVSIS